MKRSEKYNSQIHICHIISGDIWGGAEAQFFYLIQGILCLNQIELTVITLNEGLLTKKLKQQNIDTYVINEKKYNAFGIIFKIYNILRKRKISLIHTHGYKETILGGIAAKLDGLQNHIRTHHGKGMIDGSRKYYWIESLNFHFFSNKLISVSEDLKSFLIENRLGNQSVKVIHNGICKNEVRPVKKVSDVKKELGIPGDGIVIGTLGRMVKIKGHQYFIEGAKEVISKYSNSWFVIAGDGPLMPEFSDRINKNGLYEKIKLIGFRNDPYDILNMLDIFTLTSLHEGVPMVLLEAMYLEKPIIATNVGGIPEIIEDHKNGVLIPPKDSKSFSEICIDLIENINLRRTLSKNAKKDVIDKFTVNLVAEKVIQLYAEVSN